MHQTKIERIFNQVKDVSYSTQARRFLLVLKPSIQFYGELHPTVEKTEFVGLHLKLLAFESCRSTDTLDHRSQQAL